MLLDTLQLTPIQLVFAVFIIFLSYTIKGLSGFGSGLVAIPLLALFLLITMIVPLLGLLSYSGTIMQSMHLRKQVVWRDMLPLIPFSLMGIAIAVWLLVNVDEIILIRILGVFVLIYAVYSLLPRPSYQGGRKWAIVAGSFGGMVGALFGTGGPFYVLYLNMRHLDKGPFRATIAMIFLVDGGARILGYAISGLYTVQVLGMLFMLLPVLFLGMYAGHRLHLKIEQQRFNQLISLLLMISGGMLLYKSFNI